MSDIPMPELLSRSTESAAEASVLGTTSVEDLTLVVGELRNRLAATAAYAQTLWTTLDNVADHLREATPTRSSAGATAWEQTYGSVLSALAGAAGDSGYGAQEAARLLRASA